jgi:uncharacterized membrane protein
VHVSDSSQTPPTPGQPIQGSGLSETAAAALAYITIIPAIIFLILEPYNRSPLVRFHAWQCIFLSIAAFAVHTILTFIPVIGWIIIPFASLGFLVLWIIALLKALKGERYRLPIIGNFAMRQANA